MLTNRWQEYFMRLAKQVATGSKDGSSKVGAILVRPDKTVASIGFNGFPARIEDRDDFLTDPTKRADKYPRIVHAEANCLNYSRDYNSDGFHLFVTGHPCDKCSLRIASTGITHVYYEENDDLETRWASEMLLSRTILEEAGVMLVKVVLTAPQN
jgi:dCMP deaminase